MYYIVNTRLKKLHTWYLNKLKKHDNKKINNMYLKEYLLKTWGYLVCILFLLGLKG